MALVLVLRQKEGKYVLAFREFPPEMKEPYSGPHKTGVHGRQGFNFADVDGDGLDEMIHALLFDEEDLDSMGYSDLAERREARIEVCRVWKWDSEKERIIQIDERAVVHKFNQSDYE
jgi:hypothetical protein